MIILFTKNSGTPSSRAWLVQFERPVHLGKINRIEFQLRGKAGDDYDVHAILGGLREVGVHTQILRMGKPSDFNETEYNLKYRIS